MLVLRNIPIVKISDAQVQENIEEKGKIKHSEIKSIICHSRYNLYIPVDGKNPDWFYQKINVSSNPRFVRNFRCIYK